ncbi:MAG: sigma-54-dependent Fis family transcriptional regulator [Nitrospinae bacterium]|nr:sigma-54-dependent Fis family transcriptional regulator [Nitrospinota bacterium]
MHDLDGAPAGAPCAQPRRDDLRVVEDQQVADALDDLMVRLFGEGAPAPRPLAAARPTKSRLIVTENEAMKRALDIARRVAPSRSTVLVHGESGTGKELVARFIHEQSDRRDRPFVAVNCAALPEALLESELFGHEKGSFTGAIARKIGKFEMADGGTILLDEVTEMEATLQAKLLRALQEGEIDRIGGRDPVPLDIRVIATTNRNIEKAVAEGAFREDLYFRLNVIPLTLPPLRERTGDVPVLADFFIRKFNGIMGKAIEGLTPAAMAVLKGHAWRGNVREMENVMERATLLARGDRIDVPDLMLPPLGQGVAPTAPAEESGALAAPGGTVAEMEQKLIMRTLDHVNWNRTKAADLLGISIRTLRNKLHEYNASIPEGKE